jgi:GntR family transcriptional regulator
MAPGAAGTPKYLHILNTLRQRITDGTYRPGAALPSESQIASEFGVARATVLKSLQALKQDGWIESQQGKANFVRGRPTARRTMPVHVRVALDESAAGELLSVAPVLAEPLVAALLNVAEGTPVFRRSRRTVGEDGPTDLVTVYLPVEVAVGSGFMQPEPVEGGLLARLASRKDFRGDYAIEGTTARRPTAEEADLLAIGKDDPVLAVTITAYTAAGRPVLASTLVIPGDSRETEHTYPLT